MHRCIRYKNAFSRRFEDGRKTRLFGDILNGFDFQKALMGDLEVLIPGFGVLGDWGVGFAGHGVPSMDLDQTNWRRACLSNTAGFRVCGFSTDKLKWVPGRVGSLQDLKLGEHERHMVQCRPIINEPPCHS